MRILIMTNSLPPAGGGEKAAWDLACELARTEHDTHFLCFAKTDQKYIKNEVKVRCFAFKKHPFLYWSTFGVPKFKEYINEIKPDIMHCHMVNAFSLLARKVKVKNILTLHNGPLKFFKKSLTQRYNYWKSVRSFNNITTVSNFMGEIFSKKYRRDVSVIPNGIDTKIFYPEELQKEKKMIFYSGRLVGYKNVTVLFDLAKIMPDWKFIFAGEGDLKNSVSLPNATFLGNQTPDELRTWYSKATYCIYPSLCENLPLVGLETMACKGVVIASNQGFKEYIVHNKNGFIIEDIDAKKIKHFIENNKEYKNIYEQAYIDVQKFSIKKIAKIYVNEYEKTLKLK